MSRLVREHSFAFVELRLLSIALSFEMLEEIHWIRSGLDEKSFYREESKYG